MISPSKLPFRIKICGVRTTADVVDVAQAGGDAVGFNFYSKSIRYLSPSIAVDMSHAAEERGVRRIGLFVDAPISEIRDVAAACPLDALQLHGHESPEDIDELSKLGLSIVKALRLPLGKLTPSLIEEFIAPWSGFTATGGAILFDAAVGGQLGGSGQQLDWVGLREWAETRPDVAWVLAGGLTPGNVQEAIETAGASSVDVASGVEGERGVKSAERIRAFVDAARKALAV